MFLQRKRSHEESTFLNIGETSFQSKRPEGEMSYTMLHMPGVFSTGSNVETKRGGMYE